jgi:RHS repeat-associated protein
MTKIKWIALLLTASLAAVPLAAADGVPARYVVTIDASASPADVGALAARLAREYGGRLEPYAEEGFSGFAIILTPQRAQLLSGDPRIASIREQRDAFLTVAPEVIAPSVKTALRPVSNAASTLAFGTYSYDPSGNVHKIVGDVGTDTFVYDHYGRVTSGTHAKPSPQTPVAQQYTYDRYGNIETIKTTALPDRTFAVNKSTNRLDAAVGNIKGTYDAAGNQRTLIRGDVAINAGFEYDALNMATETSIAGVRRHYLYNANDERLASIEAITDFGTTGKQQWTVRDPGGRLLRRFTRSSHTATLVWDEDYLYRGTQMLAAFVTDPEKVLHFHPDHLGSPRLITGNGGAKVEEHRYYAFGEELTPRVNGAEQKQFTGHERDSIDNAPAADVDYMHARYYGVREGRFLSVDPLATRHAVAPQRWNRYSYARNNPLSLVDPDGWDVIYADDYSKAAITSARTISPGTDQVITKFENDSTLSVTVRTGNSVDPPGAIRLADTKTRVGDLAPDAKPVEFHVVLDRNDIERTGADTDAIVIHEVVGHLGPNSERTRSEMNAMGDAGRETDAQQRTVNEFERQISPRNWPTLPAGHQMPSQRRGQRAEQDRERQRQQDRELEIRRRRERKNSE